MIVTVDVIQGPDLSREGALMAFGDIRVAERADWLIERIAAVGSLVIRKIGETRAGEMAVHRFLSSPHVSTEGILTTLSARTAKQCRGRRILAVQDTTEINFSGRDKKRRGLGPAGDGKTPGFFIHPVIAVDIESEAVIGLVDAQIWTRPKRKQKGRSRRFEEKESARWLAGQKAAAERLAEAASIVMVSDREADIYEVFAERPANVDVIVRAAQDRCLCGDDGKLFAALREAPRLATTKVRVVPRKPGEKERIAEVELRAATVSIARPSDRPRHSTPESVTMTYVEAREVNAPKGAKPLLWRLLTTLPVTSAEDAAEIVSLYRLRWQIEQVFRALKSDGLALEDTQVIDAERLFKLAALGLAGAIRTIQLVQARDGSDRPISDVIDESFLEALRRLSRKLEGATAKQKNPHPPESLGFLTWITARLGGWNCYYGKPGPKTIRNGWNELAATLAGYVLATHGEFP
jgi:hypothetical protein